MDLKKAVFILFFVFAVAFAKDYSLTNAELTYTINSDGVVHVNERITYSLDGCFHELYLEKPTDLIITDATGYCENAECTFQIDEPEVSVSGARELILSLHSGGCDNTVTAVFDYTIYAIKLYNDTAQFYYKLWGEWWEKPVPLKIKIILPGDVKETTYFIHSFSDFQSSSQGNTILISARQPSQSYLEINLLMPLEWFENQDSNVYYRDDKHSKSDIIKIEEKQLEEQKFWKSLTCVIFLFSLSLVLVPLLAFPTIYYVFGREYLPKEVGYFGEYEREPPSQNTPAEAPFFIEGEFSQNALPATLMQLVYKGYFDILEDKAKNDIILVPGRGKGELKEYEKDLLDYINSKMEKGKLSMKKFKSEVSSSYGFYTWFNDWERKVKKSADVDKYIEYKGYEVAKWVFGAFILMDVLIFFGSSFLVAISPFAFDASMFLSFGAVFGFVVSSILSGIAKIKKIWFARWTKEGRLLNLKWSNFRKYLSDFTLLKERPPSSVRLWDYYMSYAVAFGVAEETLKAMKVVVPAKEMRSSRLYPLYYQPVYFSVMRSSFTPSYSPPSRSSGGYGSIGGFGGGFGGGGGGAR